MGLTSWTGGLPRRTDAEIAKNYLSPEELDMLNRIVSLYFDFAELQAQSHKPMYMKDWIQKLDDFLKLSGKELLTRESRVRQIQGTDAIRAFARRNPFLGKL